MQVDERTRKNQTVVLQAIGKTTLLPIAEYLKKDISTISRMQDEQLQKFCAMLAVCDLKIVPAQYRCAKPEIIAAAFTFAKAAMELDHPTLVFDD